MKMKVYYNALKRLRQTLEEENLEGLLLSTPHGQMINVPMVECDYYTWENAEQHEKVKFDGEFLSEYSWGEVILANILQNVE